MSSPFFGLNIGASALRTAQMQVDITNQNIANANTPGYSRQSAVLKASLPYPIPVFSSGGGPGQLGTGVEVTEINRARNTFVDYQMRNQLNTQGQVEAHADALEQVEATINEPSTTGLSSTLTKYWAAWQEVANSPSDSSVRSNLIEQGKAVAEAFTSQITQFTQQQRDLDRQVGLAVTSVNTLSGQIANLNKQVAQVETSGMHANDLRDQRDQLVDSLSKFVKINIVEAADGSVSINVGNHQLVDRDVVHLMFANTAVGSFGQVQWADGRTAAKVTGSTAATTITAPGGALVINGVSVNLVTGRTPAQVVGDINSTSGLGTGGAVVASLDSGGKLVLTSTLPGASGSINVAGPPGSISTDLGMVATTVTGADNPVNLGGGQLQGLIESRDQLLQERIDDVNNLASRVIESVNSVHVSGVGLDGKGGRPFFSGSNATDIAVDSQLTAAGGTDRVGAARMYVDAASASGYTSAAGDSSNAIALAQLQNLIAQRTTGGTGIAPGDTLGGSTLVGLDLTGASANTTYTFSVLNGTPPTVTVSPGTGPAKITLGKDAAGKTLINVDSGTSRLTLSATTAGFDLYTSLSGLDTMTVTTNPGPSTIGDQYARQIASIGVESQTAKAQSSNQAVLINQLTQQKASTSGVSLDEETINLMMYQKAYQASARVISVMDSMLDTLINNTGRVGR